MCAMLASAYTVSEATLLSTTSCTDFASAVAALATPRTRRVSSATRPTPDIALSAVCSAYIARRCATETPNGDATFRGAGDAERPRDGKRHHANAELGPTDD